MAAVPQQPPLARPRSVTTNRRASSRRAYGRSRPDQRTRAINSSESELLVVITRAAHQHSVVVVVFVAAPAFPPWSRRLLRPVGWDNKASQVSASNFSHH